MVPLPSAVPRSRSPLLVGGAPALFLLLFVLPVVATAQTTIYVDASVGTGGSGTSWGDAYSNLQDALSAAGASDEIWIAEGTYFPDEGSAPALSDGMQDTSFTITGAQDGLEIYGGFEGISSETALSDRDPKDHRVILSGDVGGDDVTTNGVTERASDISGGNSHHVLFLDGSVNDAITTSTVIDGVTVTGGQANGGSLGADVQDNWGGGLFCEGQGGICNPTLRNVVFAGNFADKDGGAIKLNAQNTSGESSPVIANTVFSGNSAPLGGAVHTDADGASSSTISPEFTNVVFAHNTAAGDGGAFYIDAQGGATNDALFTNVVFTGNSASGEGGAVYSAEASPKIRNSILWNNSATNAGDEVEDFAGSVTISHTIVQNGAGGVGGAEFLDDSGTSVSFSNSTNLDVDPQFAGGPTTSGADGFFGTADDSLALSAGSPALDVGDGTVLPADGADLDGDGNTSESVPVDLTGAPRTQDGDEDNTATVDLGPYERADPARTVYVDSAATAVGDGSTWGTAFRSLHDALGDATGNDEIWIAEGTYFPDEGSAPALSDGKQDTSFTITGAQDSLEIYGGFASGDAFGDRSPSDHPVVLSGDVDQDDDPLAPDVDDDSDPNTPTETDHLLGGNSQHVLRLDGTGAPITRETIIDGVTVVGGQADAGSNRPAPSGGGLLCDGSGGGTCSPTIRNATFRANAADLGGGGIALFAQNGTAEPVIANATFYANATSDANTNGGGLQSWGESGTASPVLVNVTFRHNHAPDRGGAIYYYALSGTADGRVVNTVFVNNEASGGGGAIANNRGRPTITNATFAGNRTSVSSGDGGALLNVESAAAPQIDNSILWGNRAGGTGDQVHDANGATSTFSYSLVQGRPLGGPGTLDGTDPANDPQFANATDPVGPDGALATADDGLVLTAGSPAADAGSGSALPSDVADLDGDDNTAEPLPEALTGAAREDGTVNMGAYEREAAPRVLRVDADAGGDGTSWGTAFATLQAALDVANSADEIWIAEGVYTPDPGGTDASTSFRIGGGRDGLTIYGGFEGVPSETTPSDRSPSDHPVVLSGDLGGDDLDRTASGATPTASDVSGPNSHNVLLFDGGDGAGTDVIPNVTPATVLSGVTVTAGQADGSGAAEDGAGVHCDGQGAGNACSPTLRNVVFVGNSAAGNGGALYNNGGGGASSPVVTNALFAGNSANIGGAMYNNAGSGASSPEVTNAHFVGNSADFDGAAMYNSSASGGTSTPTITNTILWDNDGGAGVSNNGATPTFSHSLVQSSGGSNWSGPGSSNGGNLDADPQFVAPGSPAGADGVYATRDDGLLVQPGSPVLDAGQGAGLSVATDLTGTDRVQNGTVDVGAYEGAAASPRITDTSPPRNATAVDTTLSAITVTFDAPIDAGTVAPESVRVAGDQLGRVAEATASVDVTDSTITYEPARTFRAGERVRVSVAAGVADTLGVPLDTARTVQFTAETRTVPPAFPVDDVLSDTASTVNSVETVDLDNDGRPDVLAAIDGADTIGWFAGDGAGGFSGLTVIDDGLFSPFRATAADLDSDGDPDVIGADASGNEVRWYENDGTSTPFAAAGGTVLGTGTAPQDVVAADVNGDGAPDLVVAADGDGEVVWHENRLDDGLGFSAAASIGPAPDASVVAVADVDGDGTLDVVSGGDDDRFAWHDNTAGDGSSWTTTAITAPASILAAGVATGDLDGDGTLDVLTATQGQDGRLAWHDNTAGDGSSWATTTLALDGADAVLPADVDGDGDLDVLYGTRQNRIAWFDNTDGAGTFSSADRLITEATAVLDLGAGDLDGNGTLDPVAGGLDQMTVHPNATIAPQVVTEPASDTTARTVVAEGAVNPGGLQTTVQFQYGTDTTFGPDSTVTATASPLTGEDTVAVTAPITDLVPGTTYYYRVKAGNSIDTVTADPRSVRTDDVPVLAVDDTLATVEDSAIVGTVLENDLSPQGVLDAATVAVVDSPRIGTATVDAATGEIAYAPAPDSNGIDDFTYRVANEEGAADTAAVQVTVSPVNDAPIPRPDSVATPEGQSLTVAAPGLLRNDRDPDVGDSLRVQTTPVEGPAHAALTLRADGGFDYVPRSGYSGPDRFVYRVVDDSGATARDTAFVDVRAVTLTAALDTARAGSRRVGRAGRPVRLTFRNAGEVPLSGFEVTTRGPAAADLQVAGGSGDSVLAPGATRRYDVRFRPTSTGRRTGTVRVTAAEQDTAETAVVGRGVSIGVQAPSPRLTTEASVDVTITGGFVPGADTTLAVRRGGEATYRALPLRVDEGLQDGTVGTVRLSGTVPDSLVTTRGVDYYLALAGGGPDGAADTLTVPAGGLDAARQRPRHLPVAFENLTAPVRLAPRRYEMVSVPAAVSDGGIRAALRTAYGAYSSEQWRVERWTPTDDGRGTYRNFPQLDTLRAGDGFWLITRDGASFSVPAGRTLAADSARQIPLEAGWNQVGNPFGFAVPWDTIQTASELTGAQFDGPVAYRDTTYRDVGVLEPWTGYFVFSRSPDTLRVPPVGPRPSQGRSAGADSTRSPLAGRGTASASEAPSRDARSGPDDRRYTLTVEARSADGRASTHLGLWPGARTGRDRFDVAQVPRVRPGLRLGALEPVGEGTVPHTSSVRPRPDAGTGGSSWTLRLRNAVPRDEEAGGATSVRLRLSAVGKRPTGHRRYLLDLKRERRLAPGAPLELAPGTSRRLKVIVGTESYAEANSDGIDLDTFVNALRGNYPNPFERTTTLAYTLATEQEVTVEIYNVLGQRVRTLVQGQTQRPGLHRLRWDGENPYGQGVGSGVYFLRIRADDFTATRKMVLVR